MNIEQIRRTMEVYNAGSINRAARNLYIAQSSLSSSIQALECEIGQPIFDRSHDGVELTPFGSQFIKHAQEILGHIEQIERLGAYFLAGTATNRLNLVVYFLLFASNAWAQFCEIHRDEAIELNYMERNRSDMTKMICSGQSELGIIMLPSVDKQQWLSKFSAQSITYHQITSEDPYVVVGAESEFRSAEFLTPTMLANRKMIIIPEEDDLFLHIDASLFKAFKPSSYLGVSDRGSLINMLTGTESYYLGTFNKKAYARVPYYKNTVIIPLREVDFDYEIGYIHRSGHVLSEYALAYLQMIQNMVT